MNYQTISEIYDANDKIRARLKETVSDLEDGQLNFLPAGGEWTIANIVEHVSLVESGITRIFGKILAEAQSKGVRSDGTATISEAFLQKASQGLKLQAPERVRPTGTVKIEASFVKMEETREKLEELRPLFETVECSEFKFPHPYFGDLTAHEWLALLGGHEVRHTKQIEEILRQIK
jgi:hypothetical protein